MMFGWESNKILLRKYMSDHAEDIGRFYAEMFLSAPAIYTKFLLGFMDELQRGNKQPKE